VAVASAGDTHGSHPLESGRVGSLEGIVSDADFHHHWSMGVDPHKAWDLFASDPPDFLAICAFIIVVVGGFVWWLRRHLTKERIAMLNERIATIEQRLVLAREEQAAVTKQIEILKPQLGEARAQLAKATAWLIEVKSKPAAVSNAIAQLKEAQSNSTQASTTVGVLSNANDALGATLASNTTGSRDTPLALKEWAKRQKD
jgi:septal ring factor EnvC (AmiA/AmiB activator)